jgi:hypothetical protein
LFLYFKDRRTADQNQPPQTLPVLHEGAELVPNEKEPTPACFEANVDIFFFTWLPPQAGQTTSSILLRLRTRSSKDSSHSVQTNSKIGMVTPGLKDLFTDWMPGELKSYIG